MSRKGMLPTGSWSISPLTSFRPAKVQTPRSHKTRWFELLEKMMVFAVDVIVCLRLERYSGSNAFYSSI